MSGVWGWLRGGGERGSCESVSSVGSACTAASFAFAGSWPPAPPAAQTQRRVAPHLPLHVKYGLPQDATTLPVRRPQPAPARRANSECGPRRVHVPGKRRAPPPPALPSLRRRATKRPAPRPPSHHRLSAPPVLMDAPPDTAPTASTTPPNRDFKLRPERSFLRQIFDNRWRNSSAETPPPRILPSISELDREASRILETMRTRASLTSGDPPTTTSGDSSSNWICTRCLRKYGRSTPICVYCLPSNKPTGSVVGSDRSSRSLEHSTQTTLSNLNSSNFIEMEEKERLKEMLKEIKDSLPKRLKHNTNEVSNQRDMPRASTSAVALPSPIASHETPTLPIGSSITNNFKDAEELPLTLTSLQATAASSKFGAPNTTNKTPGHEKIKISEAVLVTHQIIKMEPQERRDSRNNSTACTDVIKTNVNNDKPLEKQETKFISKATISSQTDTKKESEPLRISALLNPVYISKSSNQNTTTTSMSVLRTEIASAAPSDANKPNNVLILNNDPTTASSTQDRTNDDFKFGNAQSDKKNLQKSIPASYEKFDKTIPEPRSSRSDESKNPSKSKTSLPCSSTSTSVQSDQKSNFSVDLLSQHSKKRELINQLEQSISKGDERAAAEAASKLAQLRLSCSVLSYTSQIMAEPSSSKLAARYLVTDTKNKISEQQEKLKPKVFTPMQLSETKNEKNKVISKVSESKSNMKQDKASGPTKQVKPGTNLPGPSTSREVAGKTEDHNMTMITVWVEDKEDTRGPISLLVPRSGTLLALKRQAEALLGLEAPLQRWIVGKTLCNEDDTPLVTLAGSQLSAPFYLCLVEADTKKQAQTPNEATKPSAVYSELIALEKRALIPNAEAFECGVCLEEIPVGEGAVLRECAHAWCLECMEAACEAAVEGDVRCPALGCTGSLQEREVRGVLPADRFERWLGRGLRRAASSQPQALYCRTPDCAGWALADQGVTTFMCPVCEAHNCVPCQTIHIGETCAEHRNRLESASAATTASDDASKALLDSMVAKGEALPCPHCGMLLTKKWGCDWLKCPACGTEICWVTRSRRWGPAGRGDTSAGCRCGVDGRRCHPTCTYCH